MKSIDLNGCQVTILPVIKGLVSEEAKVQEAFEQVRPEVVGISIANEELEGLAHKEEYEFMEPSFVEQVYKANLETFGEVKMPPPAYVMTMDLCGQRGVKLLSIDMNEELFSETYCEKIGGLDLLRDSYFSSKVHKVRFDLSSPEKFVLSWDKRINKGKGFRELNEARERHMAGIVRTMCDKYSNILAIIEMERAEGVIAQLNGNSLHKD